MNQKASGWVEREGERVGKCKCEVPWTKESVNQEASGRAGVHKPGVL